MSKLFNQKYEITMEAKRKGLKGLTIKQDKKNNSLILTVRNLVDLKKVENFNSYKGLNYLILVKVTNKTIVEKEIKIEEEILTKKEFLAQSLKSEILDLTIEAEYKNKFGYYKYINESNHQEIRISRRPIESLIWMAEQCEEVVRNNPNHKDIAWIKKLKHNIMQRANEVYSVHYKTNYID